MSSNQISSLEIDRTSEVPYYLQLAQIVEKGIDRGHHKVGERLPSETDFCNSFGLARSTVREMLRFLAEKGRIKLVPRRGAFVIDVQDEGWNLQVTKGFLELEVDQHHRVETKVVGAERIELPENIGALLELDKPAFGFQLSRVRSLDGKLAVYSVNVLLPEIERLVVNSDVITGMGSLNKLLHSNGYETFRARRSVEAKNAPLAVTNMLGVSKNEPLLLVTSLSWDKHNRPFDYYTSWLRTDVVKVTVDAQASTV